MNQKALFFAAEKNLHFLEWRSCGIDLKLFAFCKFKRNKLEICRKDLENLAIALNNLNDYFSYYIVGQSKKGARNHFLLFITRGLVKNVHRTMRICHSKANTMQSIKNLSKAN